MRHVTKPAEHRGTAGRGRPDGEGSVSMASGREVDIRLPSADDPDAISGVEARMAHSRMRTWTAAVLYVSAGVLVLFSLVLSAGHRPVAYVVPTLAVVTGLVLFPVGRAVFVPLWVNELLSVGGASLIALLVLLVNPTMADVPGVFVVYVAAYAWFFYPRPRAFLHATIGAGAYGIGLWIADVDYAAARWLVIAGASIVAAVLVARLAESDRRAAVMHRELAERTRRLASTRELLLVAVSHELRTPLTLVAGTAALLHERFDDLSDERRRQLLTSQDTHARRLVRLVEDLDALHQLAQDALVAGPELVDLRSCAEESVPPELAEDIRLSVDVPRVQAWLDPRFCRRILENLLRNAVRHTPPGSEVLLSGRVEGDLIVLEVADAGEGVPDLHKTAIFEPFVRLHTDRAGSGVGLALVAALARAHGGTATVLDRPGGGSVFRVTLRQLAPVGEPVAAG